MGQTIADIINGHLLHRHWTVSQFARAANIPKNTAYQWTKGRVIRVHQWQYLAQASIALELNKSETNDLLKAGGYEPLDVIALRTRDEADLKLLGHWSTETLGVRTNLPHQITSFVGRIKERAYLGSLLTSPLPRLITLTGAGGSGKTRLALETGFAALDHFDEIWFIDLSTLRESNQVVPAIAWTIGARETTTTTVQQAVEQNLRGRHALLVLDNLEQIPGIGGVIARLLFTTERVHVLTTSRQRLNVRGEHVVVVDPLPVTHPGAAFDELASNPAVMLFADRASAVDYGFRLTPQLAPLVARLCTQLDGLPLGVELVAAHLHSMSLQEVIDHFPGRLAMTATHPQDAPERHQTLRSTIAWSYALLPNSAQHVLAVLGAFANGYTTPIVTNVCAHILPDIDVNSTMALLADHSLIRRSTSESWESRFEMLETVREFALEQLVNLDCLERVRTAHAEVHSVFVEQADLQGQDQELWIRRLSGDYDNIGLALSWCRDHDLSETGLRLCVALMPFWHLRDMRMAAMHWLETFMVYGDRMSPTLKAKGLMWQGLLLVRNATTIDSVFGYFNEALEIFRHHDDIRGASEVLQNLGEAYRRLQQWDQAERYHRESMHLAELIDDAYLIAHSHIGLALTLQETDRFDDANDHWMQALRWSRKSGNTASETLVLNSLGEMARSQSDWDAAKEYYERALTHSLRLESTFWRALALHNLGYVSLFQGQICRARHQFLQSLQFYKDLQYPKGQAECLAGLAKTETAGGQWEYAAQLAGMSESILQNLGAQLDTIDRADYRRTLADLRLELGDRLDGLVQHGRGMIVDDVLEISA